METMIHIAQLVNAFGQQQVHENLDLTVYRGEILGIVGGSGSGKSVLLRSILGLQQPQAGHIYFAGQDLLQMPSKQLAQWRRRWGVMFQRGALFSSLSVGDNILFPLREFARFTPAESRALMHMRLQMVGLQPSVASKFPADLSGGMVKRVALARALVLDPQVLFLDEPTSGLDPRAAEEFDQLLVSLHQQLGLTVIMVTHDLNSLSSVCDRVGILVDKRMVVDTLAALLVNPHPAIQAYFSSNRAQALKGNH